MVRQKSSQEVIVAVHFWPIQEYPLPRILRLDLGQRQIRRFHDRTAFRLKTQKEKLDDEGSVIAILTEPPSPTRRILLIESDYPVDEIDSQNELLEEVESEQPFTSS